jgi:hypothetical protein
VRRNTEEAKQMTPKQEKAKLAVLRQLRIAGSELQGFSEDLVTDHIWLLEHILAETLRTSLDRAKYLSQKDGRWQPATTLRRYRRVQQLIEAAITELEPTAQRRAA